MQEWCGARSRQWAPMGAAAPATRTGCASQTHLLVRAAKGGGRGRGPAQQSTCNSASGFGGSPCKSSCNSDTNARSPFAAFPRMHLSGCLNPMPNRVRNQDDGPAAKRVCRSTRGLEMVDIKDWEALATKYKAHDETRETVIKRCRDMQVEATDSSAACWSSHWHHLADYAALVLCLLLHRNKARMPSSRCTEATSREQPSSSVQQKRWPRSSCPP